jgi:hypothetical protein
MKNSKAKALEKWERFHLKKYMNSKEYKQEQKESSPVHQEKMYRKSRGLSAKDVRGGQVS